MSASHLRARIAQIVQMSSMDTRAPVRMDTQGYIVKQVGERSSKLSNFGYDFEFMAGTKMSEKYITICSFFVPQT